MDDEYSDFYTYDEETSGYGSGDYFNYNQNNVKKVSKKNYLVSNSSAFKS